jgi:putative membrane protein
MMHYSNYHLGGFHFIWWIFGLITILLIIAYILSGSKTKKKNETPLDILKRRLAIGVISEQEYQVKKKALEN